MLNSNSPSNRQKHEIVRERLTESLRSGEFVVGRRLPGDKDLAERFGVSYMTARQAVNELVEASLLERRIGDGTYVREGSQQRLSTVTLNLICTTYESSTTRAFLQLAGVAAHRRGWRAHVIRIHPDHELSAVRAIENGELSLVLADENSLKGVLSKAMRGAKGRTVLLGGRMDEQGVPSVLAHDAHAVQIAAAHLQGLGIKKIALLCNHPKSPNERVQIEAWNEILPRRTSAAQRQNWLIVANTPRFECASRFAYDAMRGWLHQRDSKDDVRALITVSEEVAIGALCACRDAGLSVPGEMALVNLNDSAAMEFSNPRVTCVDINLEAHVERALEMLGTGLQGQSVPSPLQLIEPRLIERESSSPPSESLIYPPSGATTFN